MCGRNRLFDSPSGNLVVSPSGNHIIGANGEKKERQRRKSTAAVRLDLYFLCRSQARSLLNCFLVGFAEQALTFGQALHRLVFNPVFFFTALALSGLYFVVTGQSAENSSCDKREPDDACVV